MSETTFHGTESLVAAKTDNTVAFTDADQVQDVKISQEGNVLDVHELGNRVTKELKEGKIVTEISFTRFWESGNFSACGATLQALLTAATVVYVALFPEGDASPKVLMNQCKCTSWGISVNIDGLLVETVKFKAISITIS